MVGDSERQSGAEPTPSAAVAPGAMSALLRELASAPISELPQAWPRALAAGSVVGRFELLREVGRGGFGVVYEARDRTLGRLVAFKAVRPGPRAADLQRQGWLWHEAEAAAQLSHPNIVTLYDVGTSELGPYLVFELLQGESLEHRLNRGPMPFREALPLAIGVARALAYAHAAGVIHRDLKPANVFLTETGGVKVLDFGLAHVFGTSALSGGGTPVFMAPEQCRGRPEDARTDVFGLGTILFMALTGRPPYELRDGRTTALDGRAAPRPPDDGVPAALADLVQQSLESDRARRPRDGGVVLEELLSIERSLTPVRSKAFRLAAGASAAVLIALAAALIAVRGPAPLRAQDPYVVAVIDVVNETGEADLDSLSGLLITSLEQSRRFRVLTRTRLHDLLHEMGHGGTARIDEALGRAAATRAHANAVLVPVVRRFGGIYSVEMKGFDPASDAYLFAVEERGAERQSLPGVIDRLSERTRRALRESAQDVEKARIRVAESVTSDLEAYRHYFLGTACLENDSLNGSGCVPHFRRALEIDPTFALAQYQLAYLADFDSATADEQREAFEAALKHLDRFPARERSYVLAWRAHLEGDDAKAVSIYQRLLEAYPDDKEAQYLTGDLYLHMDEPELARPYFDRTVALDSAHQPALLHLMDALAVEGKTEEMVSVARRTVDEHPGSRSQLVLAWALAHSGDPAALDAARRAADESEGVGHDENEAVLADMLLFFGRYGEAVDRLHAAQNHASPQASIRYALVLANALAYQGRRRDGLRALEADALPEEFLHLLHSARVAYLLGDAAFREMQPSLRWLHDHDARHYGETAAALAYIRQFDAAADAARALAPGTRDERLYHAVLRWRRGDASGAADDLAALSSRHTVRGNSLAYEPWFYAEALAEAGRDAEAITALQRFQRICSWFSVYRSWAYPRSLFLLARAHARRGQRVDALRTLDQLLLAWRSADADSPLLREATELRAELVGAARRQ